MKKMLLIVDPQIDFISGTLPVPGADAAMTRLAEYVMRTRGDYAATVVTTDWHPGDHSSFTANGGPWPRHCVQGESGADVFPPLAAVLPEDAPLLRKGTDAAREEYSIFQNAASARELARLLREGAITHVDVCGIAGDVCVLNTLKDAIRLHPDVRFSVLTEFAPSLDGGVALSTFIQENGL